MSEQTRGTVIKVGFMGDEGSPRYTVRRPDGAVVTVRDDRIRDESPIKFGDVVWVTEGKYGDAWISGVEKETK